MCMDSVVEPRTGRAELDRPSFTAVPASNTTGDNDERQQATMPSDKDMSRQHRAIASNDGGSDRGGVSQTTRGTMVGSGWW